MKKNLLKNNYAELLRACGDYVLTIKGIDWYCYKGFMVPAYLPHCVPKISREVAKQALTISKRPFIRWDTHFGQLDKSPWWYLNRRHAWSLEQCSGNTRSKIRRGRKKLSARMCKPEEILEKGYQICLSASKRYEKNEFILPEGKYKQKIHAAEKIKGVLEFYGVFSNDKLVGYSENYIQEGGVFWESIWYDPVYLRDYSSYVLTDAMLNHYLNERKFSYVSDGSRSIYHRTNVQNFFIDVFGFQKEYAALNVIYLPAFEVSVKLTYPLRKLFWFASDKWNNGTLAKIAAIQKQESICRECKSISL